MTKRFQYHFEPKKGWMNDPNGLIQYQGVYHAFFQYYPHDIKWGPMHWGHAISRDLLHWEEQDIALSPTQPYEDDGGCFSGSAIEKDGKMYLFYTSVSHALGQTQSLAISEDGLTFTKYDHNPIIQHFPAEDATKDFRDPKVFVYGDEYRMILGTVYKGCGRVLQYRSKDLIHWEYMGVLYESSDYHDVIECPDLFPLQNRWVLLYSKIEPGDRHVQFLIGNFDGERFTPHSTLLPERGPQFYASQTFLSEDGKRILISWFYDWMREPIEGSTSAGALTIPREVYLDERGHLCLYPVDSAKALLEPLPLDNSAHKKAGVQISASPDSVKIISRHATPQLYEGKVEKVEVLADVKAVEVFINNGKQNYSVWGH